MKKILLLISSITIVTLIIFFLALQNQSHAPKFKSITPISPLSQKKVPQSEVKIFFPTTLLKGEMPTYNDLKVYCNKLNPAIFQLCLEHFFTERADIKGFSKVQDELQAISQNSNGLEGECHTVGHYLGYWAFGKYGEQIIPLIKDTCGFATGHGAMESAGKILSHDKFISIIGNFCLKSINKTDCVHGLGHGLRLSNFNIQEMNLACTTISNSMGSSDDGITNYGTLCGEGWAMSDLNQNTTFWGKRPTPAQALNLCNKATGYPQLGCNTIAFSDYVLSDTLFQKNLTSSIAKLPSYNQYCLTLKNNLPGSVAYCQSKIGYTLGSLLIGNYDTPLGIKVVKIGCGTDLNSPCLSTFLNSSQGLLINDQNFVNKFCKNFLPENLNKCVTIAKENLPANLHK